MTLQIQDGVGTPQYLSVVTNPQDNGTVTSSSLVDAVTGNRLKVSPFGELSVTNDGTTPCFRAVKLAFAPVAAPTDAIIIQGSATKTIRIKMIQIGGVATAQGNMPVQLIRRSSIGTLGTAVLTAVTSGNHDPLSDGAATAVISTVGTANISVLGTQVAILGVGRINMPAVSTGPVAGPTSFDFCMREDKAMILRGTSDFLCINFNGATIPSGGVIDFQIEFEEDNS